jgi:hypothetical protein
VAFSPQANYTDLATVAGRRILAQTFADKAVSRGQRCDSPTVVNLGFLGWADPIPNSLLVRNLVAPGIETRYIWDYSQEYWPLDHRGGHLVINPKPTILPTVERAFRAGLKATIYTAS